MFRLIVATCMLMSISIFCSKNSIVQPTSTGTLNKAKIIGSLENRVVGDSIKLIADFDASGSIDTSNVSYSWKLSQNDSTVIALTDRYFTNWVPTKPGQYCLSLDITFENKTVSLIIILVVMERIVYVDSNQVALLKAYKDSLPGFYIGEVTTPWAPSYHVAMSFKNDGTYIAYNTESDMLPALYYGTDANSLLKTWELDDVKSNGTVSGKIVIVFDVGTTVQDDIREIQFNEKFDTLQFSMWHFGSYGPVQLKLTRIDSASMPSLPLPTPSIIINGPMLSQEWKDSVIVHLNAKENLDIVYQILPMPAGDINLLNPMSLWRNDVAYSSFKDSLVVRSTGPDYVILARSTDGVRYSGVAAQIAYFAESVKK